MKTRLYAGTINRHHDEDGWSVYDLDVSPRGIWDREIEAIVSPDFTGTIAHLPQFREEMWDEIVSHHVLEHLAPDEAVVALAELHRILKTGGTLDIEVPDVDRVARAWVAGELDHAGLSQWLLGEQLPVHQPGDSHRSAWTEDVLRDALTVAGFVVGGREESGLALRFIARKP